MRALNCELASVEKPDGSVIFKQGDTKVICGVYGPAEVKGSREIVDKATIDCIVKPKTNQPGCKERAVEAILSGTCEEIVLTNLHPRSAIQIVLQITQDSGSLLSCLINGACMALMHAGIPMKSMVIATTCAITSDGQHVIDPDKEQETEARCVMTIAFDSRSYNLITSHTVGQFSVAEYYQCVQLCRSAAQELSSFQRLAVERFLSKSGLDEERDGS